MTIELENSLDRLGLPTLPPAMFLLPALPSEAHVYAVTASMYNGRYPFELTLLTIITLAYYGAKTARNRLKERQNRYIAVGGARSTALMIRDGVFIRTQCPRPACLLL